LSLTLLVEKNSKVESIYALNLLTWLGLETVTKKKSSLAIEELEKDCSQFKLIIVRSVIEKEQSAKAIIDFVKNKDLKIPVIMIGPGAPLEGISAHIPNSLQIKPLIQACAKALGITAKEMMEKALPDFFPIPIIFFRQLKRSTCPAYLQDLDDDQKFELKIEKLKEYDQSFINEMIKQGAGTLFIDKMDRLEFVNNLTSEFMSILKESDLSIDENITATEKGVELLSKKLLTIGVTEETIVLAKKSMDAMKKTARTNPNISKLLQRMLSNQSGYLFKHTQIVTFVSLHIIKNIDWGNPEQEDKISFISFFHDIALENDAQAIISSTAELKKATLTPAARSLVEKHAKIAAELVSKFPHAPMGSDQIIRQHHGVLNGIGFSDHYGGNISPVAVVLIIAEAFAKIILKHEGTELNRKELLQELKIEFPNARFQKVLSLLETITF
jgi:HD-GYP domain-containing protein (c-di-GMP phosphodiesterase class II)